MQDPAGYKKKGLFLASLARVSSKMVSTGNDSLPPESGPLLRIVSRSATVSPNKTALNAWKMTTM